LFSIIRSVDMSPRFVWAGELPPHTTSFLFTFFLSPSTLHPLELGRFTSRVRECDFIGCSPFFFFSNPIFFRPDPHRSHVLYSLNHILPETFLELCLSTSLFPYILFWQTSTFPLQYSGFFSISPPANYAFFFAGFSVPFQDIFSAGPLPPNAILYWITPISPLSAFPNLFCTLISPPNNYCTSFCPPSFETVFYRVFGIIFPKGSKLAGRANFPFPTQVRLTWGKIFFLFAVPPATPSTVMSLVRLQTSFFQFGTPAVPLHETFFGPQLWFPLLPVFSCIR